MKKIILILLMSIGFASCSNNNEQDSSNCFENNTPENGFIYQGDTYDTGFGRINMDFTDEFQKTNCLLEFINSNYSDFTFEDGDSNINVLTIWISVPSEYYQLQEIPEGNYQLREQNDDPSTLDILTLGAVGPNMSASQSQNSDYVMINGLIIVQPNVFQRAELTVVKLPSCGYKINYLFETDGKIVEGYFKGFLSFVDNWV